MFFDLSSIGDDEADAKTCGGARLDRTANAHQAVNTSFARE